MKHCYRMIGKPIINCSNCQDSFTLFHDTYTKYYEKCFPTTKVSFSYYNRKPWLSVGLRNSIKTKNKLYCPFRRLPTTYSKVIYKQYRQNLNKLLRKAERNYYDFILKQNQNNIKMSWQIIKQVINKNKYKSMTCDKLLVDNKVVTNKTDIANTFNNYFVNVGPSLASQIPNSNKNPISYINHAVVESMYAWPTDATKIRNIILELKLSSPGWDNINAKVLKSTYNAISEPLVHIVNLSLSQGLFPNKLKLARVIPLYKNDNAMFVTNYRPVSVLTIFSKLFERIVYKRLLSFINKHNILYNYQFGFRKGHSTQMALLCLVDKISSAVNDGDFVLGLFLDFSKAFDM